MGINFYTMKMRCGQDGPEMPDITKAFITTRKIVAIGDPEYTDGAWSFQNEVKFGDIIVFRQPLALLKVTSVAEKYHPDGQFPDFDSWLCISRKVEVLSWYDEESECNIPRFDARGYIVPFCPIKPNNLGAVIKWFQFVNGENMKKTLFNQLTASKNIILTGAPGTGKTYLAKQIASQMIFGESLTQEEIENTSEHKGKFDNQCVFVQFHPSYDYTDFVEGLRPVKQENGTIGFERKDGVFKEFCARAAEDSHNNYIFIIDEINRGDIAKIFGELFFAIDPGYRGIKGRIKTQYDGLGGDRDCFKEGFYVPENVYIIGTMNDIDRNVESMDFAIRRRFTWKEIKPDENLSMWDDEKNGIPKYKDQARYTMEKINAAITDMAGDGLGAQYQLGAAYFLKLKECDGDFNKLWEWHIAPLLREYLRGAPEADTHFDNLKAVWNASLPTNQIPSA